MPDEGEVITLFGSVSLFEETLLVGAPGDASDVSSAGAAYIYQQGGRCYAAGVNAGDCVCKDGAAGPSCAERPQCGDGNVQPAEMCDDGNVVGGDGCSAACTLEI